MNHQLIEKWGFVFAIALFLISFFIVFTNTYDFFGSLLAALLTAALGWAAFVIVRLTILAFKK